MPYSHLQALISNHARYSYRLTLSHSGLLHFHYRTSADLVRTWSFGYISGLGKTLGQ
ncbi:hypothetical protein BDV35DRAFT_336719 [Aspergillus flavus]|uniref:Uncharacterized protein n=1 Tax=Aspergillus flavus TaxID=5059 RepID=A0A5N6HDC6_ASPFL|nr:hypothetical protein BDV35DRAFT_336719 [Aspergillus flavus]